MKIVDKMLDNIENYQTLTGMSESEFLAGVTFEIEHNGNVYTYCSDGIVDDVGFDIGAGLWGGKNQKRIKKHIKMRIDRK